MYYIGYKSGLLSCQQLRHEWSVHRSTLRVFNTCLSPLPGHCPLQCEHRASQAQTQLKNKPKMHTKIFTGMRTVESDWEGAGFIKGPEFLVHSVCAAGRHMMKHVRRWAADLAGVHAGSILSTVSCCRTMPHEEGAVPGQVCSSVPVHIPRSTSTHLFKWQANRLIPLLTFTWHSAQKSGDNASPLAIGYTTPSFWQTLPLGPETELS